MLHQLLLSLFLIVPFFGICQSLSVSNTGPNGDPLNLTQFILPGGGVNVSNISTSGNNAQQIGYFSNGASACGAASGVVLSTGRVLDAMGANDSTASGTSLSSGAGSDADLLMLSGGQNVYDWYILEFDLIPSGNELSLQYLFASEEYGEFVCSQQADVFGILISGPSISGPFQNNAKLISLVPSTSIPAGINSIHNGNPGVFGNSGNCLVSGASPYYHDNSNGLFEFDAYTDILTARSAVICDSSYHIRILIADVDADGYDSGLLLPEKGLFTNATGDYSGGQYNDSLIVEGCRPFHFTIFNPTGFSPGETVTLNISGTAINGTDYNTLPTNITLNPNDSMLTLLLSPIADGMTEGIESVIISYELYSPCGDTLAVEYTLYIQDENPIVISNFPSNESICDGETVTLNLTASGGFPPYEILWNGVAQNNVVVAPNSDITFIAEVYDAAGCFAGNQFLVDHHPNPIVNAGPDINACSQQNLTLGVQIDAYAGGTYLWTPSVQLNSNSVAYPVMTPVNTQTYTITATSTAGCTAQDQLTVTVLPSPTANAGPDQSIVYLQTSAVISATGNGTASWYPSTQLSCNTCFSPEATPTDHTTYTLSVIAPNGCIATDEVVIFVEVPKDVFVPSAFSPNGDGNNDVLFARGYTISTMKFVVYDLWGQVMFESYRPDEGWDGTINGVAASIGLYVYTLEVSFVNNAGTEKFAGEFNLVR